jgi:signal transduction histidine kinase
VGVGVNLAGIWQRLKCDKVKAWGIPARLDFTALVRRTEEQMQALAEEKDISIEWKANEPVMLEGDSTRLKQVVVNLLDNALK